MSDNHEKIVERLDAGASMGDALGLSGEDVQQIAGLAAALYTEDRFESALRLLRGLVSLHPEDATYWSAIGAVLTRLERHEEAIPALSVALKLDGTDTAALVNRAECHIALADNERAVADLARAIELDPGRQDAAANRARQLAYAMYVFFEQCHEAGLDTIVVEEDA